MSVDLGASTELAVIVLAYRARSFLESGSLASVIAAARQAGVRTRVVVLDNYSRDGTIQLIAERHPSVDLLLAPANTMYCVGNNVLLQYAHHRYQPKFFALVDADNFVEVGIFRELLAFAARHPTAGVVQPVVHCRSDPGTLYSCGHRYTDDHFCRTMTRLPDDPAALHDLPSCSLASTLIRAEVLMTCGLLNPVYDIYYESSDLSFRARAHGWHCACAVEAVAYNDPTEVAGPDTLHHFYYFNRNRLIFWRLHDDAVYRVVRADARRALRLLREELASTPFGLAADKEGVRRGLEAGLRLTSRNSCRRALIPRLDEYEKTAAILLQTGSLLGAS